jgi:hypothetical protein
MGARAEQMAKKFEASCGELDRTGTVLVDAPTMTAAQAIEGILINHVHEHLGSIRATTGAK